MGKILIYTISDLRKTSLKCVDLLYNSLLYNNKVTDFDFYVVTNDLNYKNIDNFKHKFLFDSNNNTYIGWSKFTQSLPDGYDFYLYFDSDILVYESLTNLVLDNDYTIVFEDLKMSNDWFNYPFATDAEKNEFVLLNGINAGTFGFKDLNFLNVVRENCSRYNFDNQNEISQAMFEQSSFNYSFFKIMDKCKYIDITNLVKLHAKEELSDHSIYHFCGYDGFMDNKLRKMEIINDKIINLRETKS